MAESLNRKNLKCEITIKIAKGKWCIEIPISRREMHDVYDLQYLLDNQAWKTIELNKMEKSIASFFKKWEHLTFDVIGEGRWYLNKNNKLVESKERHYTVKKPRWVAGKY